MSRRRNNRGNSKPNNRQGNKGKGQECTNKPKDSEVKESPENDPSWYAKSEAMLRDSASIQFNEAAGTPYEIDDMTVVGPHKQVVPGVLVMRLMPTLGRSTDETSALNVAAKKLFATLRAYNNTANPPYDPNDLMLIETAIANVYAFINMCVRVYGLLMMYVYKNRYLPVDMLMAIGIDYSDFRDHMSQFRWDIDYMIKAIASLWAPGNIPYFAQCAQVYSGYYVEGDDVKDQLYIAMPEGFLQYEEASSTYPGGRLKHKQFVGGGSGYGGAYTRADLMTFFNDLVAPLINNTDVNIISGDVRKAFGDNIIKVNDIALMYDIVPTADLNMLEKFKNANVVGIIANTDVVPDPTQGFLVSKPLVRGDYAPSSGTLSDEVKSHGGGVIGERKMLTTIRTMPTPADVMEMTRWCPMIIKSSQNAQTSGSDVRYVYELDSDMFIPKAFQIVTKNPLTMQAQSLTFTNHFVDDGSTIGTYWAELSAFKFHPEVRIYQDTGMVAGTAGSSYDVDNYTMVTTEDIHRMNDCAAFSLFNA